MEILKGKKALVLGVANERSIAWGITQSLKQAGASVALTYVNEAIEKRIIPLAEEVKADFVAQMDVSVESHYDQLRETVEKKWGKFDILVHSLAFANADDLKGRFSDTSRDGFRLACEVSAYSLIGLCRCLKPLMNRDSSIMAMTYHGSQKVMPNYNIMGVAKAALEASVRYLAADLGPEGIRVNCISAGPIKTLAAVGISGFRDILKYVEEKAPLKKNITTEDVGNLALFLASSMSNSITGQVMYVDAGYSIMAM